MRGYRKIRVGEQKYYFNKTLIRNRKRYQQNTKIHDSTECVQRHRSSTSDVHWRNNVNVVNKCDNCKCVLLMSDDHFSSKTFFKFYSQMTLKLYCPRRIILLDVCARCCHLSSALIFSLCLCEIIFYDLCEVLGQH